MDCEIHKTLIDGKRFLKFDDAMPYIRYTIHSLRVLLLSNFHVQHSKRKYRNDTYFEMQSFYNIQGKNVGGNESKF